jgi:hypothetical protein
MKILLAVLIIMLIATGCGAEKPSLVDRIKSAGLEIEGVRTLQSSEMPPGAKSGQQFALPSHCSPDCGGKILVFDSEADAQKMAQAWGAMGQHVYVKGGTLLQINGRVDKAVADRYGEVLLNDG